MLAAAASSMVRSRLPLAGWAWLHRTSYVAWGLALWHGLRIGTDTGAGWATWYYAASAATVALAVLIRVAVTRHRRRDVPVERQPDGAGGAR